MVDLNVGSERKGGSGLNGDDLCSISHFTALVATEIIACQIDYGRVVVRVGSNVLVHRVLNTTICKPLEDV